ncbi:MAG TPA: hypothetical protein VGP15_20215 [Burkholderiales bacterium]|nr:hypothetical protein [Burkholderiales bacterium]
MSLTQKISVAAVSAALGLIAMQSHAATSTGPSSSATPYVVNVHPRVDIVSILTVGDSVNTKPDGVQPYRMVGIPDGLGAYDNGDGTFTLLMNHELGGGSGIVRQHGSTGAFISSWIIRKSDLKVLHGGDHMKQVYTYVPAAGAYTPAPSTTTFNRFCSADLPARSALYNSKTGKGYSGRIFLNGEESGPTGRAFAHIATGPNAGISYELPDMGKSSWENIVASPYEQDKTVVIGLNDTSPAGQLSVYIGEKRDTGTEIEKAGLRGGSVQAIVVAGIAVEDRDTGVPSGSAFTLGTAGSFTGFLRPEDGAWDTVNSNVFYFVTTDRYDTIKDPVATPAGQKGRSRLYRLTFKDIRYPEQGGKIDQLVDGSGPNQMFDNITVDQAGNVIIQEDVGNQKRSGRIWQYSPRNRSLTELAKHDPARFGDSNGTAPTAPYNSDEESSGIIDITQVLGLDGDDDERHGKSERGDRDDDSRRGKAPWAKQGYRYFLGDVQAHYLPGDAELVEGGQLFLMAVPK